MFFSRQKNDIISGCVQQKPLAQRDLYNMFAPKMLAVCFRYAKDRDEAEDMLQEGFIKVFQSIHKYQDSGSLEGWIRRIMVNTAIDMIRKNKAMKMETPLDDYLTETIGADAITDNLEVEYLLNIIQTLPTGYRVVFNLFAIEGYSHAEIAEQLNINESTSRSQYTRAKILLKKRINEDCVDLQQYQDAI